MKQVIFWGTRGSLPTSITHANIRAKISSALLAANGRSFRKQAELDAFVEALPFAVRGTFGGNSSCVEIVTGEVVAWPSLQSTASLPPCAARYEASRTLAVQSPAVPTPTAASSSFDGTR